MGAGNYLPYPSEVYPQTAEVEGGVYYEMVYVDANYARGISLDAEELIRQAQRQFEDTLKEDVYRYLPGSFYKYTSTRERLEYHNRYVKVVLKGEYDSYYPLFVTPTHPLGIPNTQYYARRLFEGLAARGYKLYVRTGPWTCGEYQPEPQRHAQHGAVSGDGNYLGEFAPGIEAHS